jgi:hypothetical protein
MNMRATGPVCAAFVLLASAFTAFAGTSTYVEAGKGVGDFRLREDTLKTVREKIRKAEKNPDADSDAQAERGQGSALRYVVTYSKTGLVFVAEPTKGEIVEITVISKNFVLAGTSVGVGSTAAAVRKALGKEDSSGGALVYRKRGIRFRVDKRTQTVVDITVTEPVGR